MIFEERILGIAQGLSQLALEGDLSLREQLIDLNSKVVRITSPRPYMTCYLVFSRESLEFVPEFEGEIDGHICCNALTFFRALYCPSLSSGETLESLLLPESPKINAFLTDLVRAWDLWALLQTLCADFLPFINPKDELAIELAHLQRQVSASMLQMLELQEQQITQAQQQSQLLAGLQKELKQLRYCVTVLGFCLLAAVGLGGWSLIR